MKSTTNKNIVKDLFCYLQELSKDPANSSSMCIGFLIAKGLKGNDYRMFFASSPTEMVNKIQALDAKHSIGLGSYIYAQNLQHGLLAEYVDGKVNLIHESL